MKRFLYLYRDQSIKVLRRFLLLIAAAAAVFSFLHIHVSSFRILQAATAEIDLPTHVTKNVAHFLMDDIETHLLRLKFYGFEKLNF